MPVGNPSGASTKSSGYLTSTSYTPTLGLALVPALIVTLTPTLAFIVTPVSDPAPTVPNTNDEFFK